MTPVRFSGSIRFWDPVRAAGLAVADVPADLIPSLGGLKQQRLTGTINSMPFTSSVMPAGQGRLALSVSKAMMKAAGVDIGQTADFVLEQTGRD